MSKITFKSRKEVKEFLATKDIDTSNWTEEKWLSIDQSQADIHIQPIVELMWDAYNESKPKELKVGEWHIPFGDNFDIDILNDMMQFAPKGTIEDLMVKIAVARCARISYETLGDDPKIDYEADLRLYNTLLSSKHASPMEHCAMAGADDTFYNNFKGWIQHRYLIDNNIK